MLIPRGKQQKVNTLNILINYFNLLYLLFVQLQYTGLITVFSPLKQNQFKSQGIKLIPDSAEDQAVMYQRMMEGLALTDKLSKLHLHKSEH